MYQYRVPVLPLDLTHAVAVAIISVGVSGSVGEAVFLVEGLSRY
jgi:hypothetical protein